MVVARGATSVRLTALRDHSAWGWAAGWLFSAHARSREREADGMCGDMRCARQVREEAPKLTKSSAR